MITYEFRCYECKELTTIDYKNLKEAEEGKVTAYCNCCGSKNVNKIISKEGTKNKKHSKHSSWSKW